MIISIVICILSLFIGIAIGFIFCARKVRPLLKKLFEGNQRNSMYARLLARYIIAKTEGKSIAKYLADRNMNSVVLYGMDYVGEAVYSELKNSDVKVKCAIDRRADTIKSDIDVYTLDGFKSQSICDIDAVIVSAVWSYDSIRRDMEKVVDCPIISLSDII